MASYIEKPSLKGSESRRNLKNTHSYTRRRQRKDRDASQHLLTPPLTPSSSIRTTVSTDSTDEKPNDKAQALQELQEPEATRFLYLENVSRTVAPTTLQNAITDALTHVTPRQSSNTSPPGDRTEAPAHETSCIKGFFLKHTKTTGTLFLAFHDVRDAIAAKVVLSQTTDGVLVKCLGEEKLIDGTQAWFRCRFITAEELVETIGNSNFLATTDGGFLLSVVIVDNTDTDRAQTNEENDTKRSIDLHLLVKLLESFGSLRLLKQENQTSAAQLFLVEFFDVRDASEAYTALNDQTMFGMRLCTSGRVPSDQPEKNGPLELPPNKAQDRSDTPLSTHQPSASESHLPKLKPSIGPPGEASQMRGRFISETNRPRPRAVSVDNDITSSNSPPRPSDRQPKTSSPTIFYTSFDLTDSFPTISSTAEDKLLSARTSEYDNTYSEGIQLSEQREPQQACSSVECRYCPSRGHDSTAVSQPFSNHPNPSFMHPLPFPVQSPSHLFVAPEFEPPVVFPQPGTNWHFDPHMITPIPGGNLDMFTSSFIPAIPVVPLEHCFAEHSPNPGFVSNGLAFPAITPSFHVPPPPFGEPQPPVPLEHHHIFVSNEPVPQGDDVGLKLSATNSGISDRNFLNIARIEEGLDTRTTVMVKNIPNKMTAKDLIQYINEVCPRKIDFLYLRMDFKNGCNVGYAFVNFIRVQDMLKFAKKRLGVKWNLFSSEKVLQMSYANYQGKEALVEKFKNSCIMDEREEWRPKIFYSSGPEQGLPEPFPAPTHLRRKERSSHNRGALYVPGPPAHSGSTAGNGYLNNGPMRRQDLYSTSGSKYLEHRTRSVDRCHGEDNFGGNRRGRAHFER